MICSAPKKLAMLINMFALLWIVSIPVHAESDLYADLHLRHGNEAIGTIRIDLDYERAPRPVANFVGLATGQFPWIHPANGRLMQNTPFYDGLTFHRLVHSFVLQGGDPMDGTPLGEEMGGPGYVFPDQFHPDLRHEAYHVSMAHSGPFTNGSQFFIVLESASFLDDVHSVFGVISEPASRAIIDEFKKPIVFPTDNERPLTDIIIDAVTVGGAALEEFDLFDPELWLPRVDPARIAIRKDEEGVIMIEWPKEMIRQYQVGLTDDLMEWESITNFYFSMGTEETGRIHISPPLTAPQMHLYALSVDYSSLVAPTNVLSAGATITMDLHGGQLAATFGTGTPGDIGQWTYTASGGGISSGNLTIAAPGYYGLVGMPILPDGNDVMGLWHYIQHVAIRALYLEFDNPVGPHNVQDVEVHLYFHGPHNGWLDDEWYNENIAVNAAQLIYGAFAWELPD